MSNTELTHEPSTIDVAARTFSKVTAALKPQKHTTAATKLATGLGWFSVGLGLYEILAPRSVAKLAGLQGQETLLRAYGVRELAAGAGILASPNGVRSPWVWARIAGDVLDLVSVTAALRSSNPQRSNALAALIAVAGVTALDLACAPTLQSEEHARRQTRDYSDRSGLGTTRRPAPSDAY